VKKEIENVGITEKPTDEYENPLNAPANYPLDVLLKELKRGRKAAQQHLIDRWIEELSR